MYKLSRRSVFIALFTLIVIVIFLLMLKTRISKEINQEYTIINLDMKNTNFSENMKNQSIRESKMVLNEGIYKDSTLVLKGYIKYEGTSEKRDFNLQGKLFRRGEEGVVFGGLNDLKENFKVISFTLSKSKDIIIFDDNKVNGADFNNILAIHLLDKEKNQYCILEVRNPRLSFVDEIFKNYNNLSEVTGTQALWISSIVKPASEEVISEDLLNENIYKGTISSRIITLRNQYRFLGYTISENLVLNHSIKDKEEREFNFSVSLNIKEEYTEFEKGNIKYKIDKTQMYLVDKMVFDSIISGENKCCFLISSLNSITEGMNLVRPYEVKIGSKLSKAGESVDFKDEVFAVRPVDKNEQKQLLETHINSYTKRVWYEASGIEKMYNYNKNINVQCYIGEIEFTNQGNQGEVKRLNRANDKDKNKQEIEKKLKSLIRFKINSNGVKKEFEDILEKDI